MDTCLLISLHFHWLPLASRLGSIAARMLCTTAYASRRSESARSCFKGSG